MTDVPPENDAPKTKPKTTRKAKIAKALPKVSGKTAAVAGAAIGIGSAAIVAALLYTNRNKKS